MTLRRILMLLSLLCAAIAVGIADDGAGDTERNLPEKQDEPEQEDDDGNQTLINGKKWQKEWQKGSARLPQRILTLFLEVC